MNQGQDRAQHRTQEPGQGHRQAQAEPQGTEQGSARALPQQPAPLIVTLGMDDAAFALLDGLRRAHFPPERNFLPAHITLFHALPAAEEAQVRAQLQAACAASAPLPLLLDRIRSLGRGVALEVRSEALLQLRERLARGFAPWLNAQDRQGYRPHVTLQNKVAPEQARRLHQQLSQEWTPLRASGEALLLWRYLGGPWQPLGRFPSAAAG